MVEEVKQAIVCGANGDSAGSGVMLDGIEEFLDYGKFTWHVCVIGAAEEISDGIVYAAGG